MDTSSPLSLEEAFKRLRRAASSRDLMQLFHLLKLAHRADHGLDLLRDFLGKIDIHATPDIIGSIAHCFGLLGAPEEALVLFDEIISPAQPNYRILLEDKAYAHFILDDFATGRALWQKALSRALMYDVPPAWRSFDEWSTQWSRIPQERYLDHNMDVHGKSVRILWDAAFGDAIQNLRYIHHLRREGATCVDMDIREPLVQLVESSGFNVLNTFGQPLDNTNYDYLVLHSSLFLRYEDGSPSKTAFPYITPGQANQRIKPIVDFIRQTSTNKLKVAICWRSIHTDHRCEPYRSMPITALLPLFNLPNIQCYSCNHGHVTAEEAYYLKRYQVPHLGLPIQNLHDLACVFKEVDLLVTIDSGPLHLAGAMNIPVYALLSTFSEFRWGRASNRSFLYPSLRLFRQKTLGDWAPPVAEIAAQLTRRANQRSLGQVRQRRHK